MSDDSEEFGPVVLPPRVHQFNERTLRVFYDPVSGKIGGYECSNTASTRTRNGQAYVDLAQESPIIDFRKHKIDPATGALAEMSEQEKSEARLPTDDQVKGAISSELAATDSIFAPGRPLSQADSDAWTEYRQKLRDLSKLGLGPVEQLAAWPARPDGVLPMILQHIAEPGDSV